MKKTEIQIGFIYEIDGMAQRAESIYCRDGVFYVNNSKFFFPIKLTSDFFDFLGFKFYNGWYHPEDNGNDKLLFLDTGIEDGYIVLLGNSEVEGLVIKNVHEMQRLLFAVRGIEV